MNQKDFQQLDHLLDELMKAAPCRGGPCIGYQNCEFGENGCYGESCIIEKVQTVMASLIQN